MTDDITIQNPAPQLDPDLLNAAYSPTVNKTVRGGGKLAGVKPELIDHWNSLQGEFSKAGITPEIKSGFRTAEQQNALYRNPATRAKTKGNDGYAKISPHQRGEALDISFPAYQRNKGRQIIADYAKRTGLHIPSDEPWHISLGSPQKTPNLDPDLLDAGYGQQSSAPAQETSTTPQLDTDLLSAAYGQPAQALKTPGVTSTVREADTGTEPPSGLAPQPKPVAPVPFQQATIGDTVDTLNPVGMLYEASEKSPQVSGSLQQQFEQRRFQAPESLQQSRRVKLNFSPHLNPTPQDVEEAYVKALGPEYAEYNKMHQAQTGQNLVKFRPEDLADIKRSPDGSFYVSPRKDALDYLNAYVTSGGNLERANEVAGKNRQAQFEAAQAAQAGAKQDVAEVERIRKEQGGESGAERVLTAPAGRAAAGARKFLGGLASIGGLHPNEWSDYMNRRGEIIQQGASLPPLTPEGEKINRGFLEKAGTAGVDLGLTVAQLALLKRATGLPMNAIMAGEAGIKNSDKPALERADEISKAYALGTVLESDIGKLTSGAVFGVPAAVEGSQAALQRQARGENPDWADVVLDTGIQGGLGAILGGKKSVEQPTELGIENAPVLGVQGLGALDAEQQLAEREARVQPTFLRDDQGNPIARVLNPDEVAQGAKPKVRSIHQSDTQARDEQGQFAATEAPATPEPVTQSATSPAEQPPLAAQPVRAETTATTPPVEGEAAKDLGIEATGSKVAPASQEASARSAQGKEPWRMTRDELRDTSRKVLFDKHGSPIRVGDEVTLATMYGPAKARVTGFKVKEGADTQVQVDPVQVGPPQTAPKTGFTPITEWPLYHVERTPYAELPEAQKTISAGMARGEDGHKLIVEQALKEGKPVPPEVLADYPDLAAKAADATPPKEGSAPPVASISESASPSLEPTEVAPKPEPISDVEAMGVPSSPEPSEASARPALETKPPESTTSARKAQLATDRDELDLPDLPQPERRSWKNTLIEAQNEGLDQRANAIADGVIKQPRSLTDKETAGLTLRLQQIKNEHAQAMAAVDSAKGDDLIEARQHAQDLESEFDKLSDAVKQSGTEKGRALASQKLTINQDFDLVSMLNRYKVKTGKEPTPEIRAQIESQSKRITELESQLAKAEESGRAKSVSDAVAQMDREARRVRRQTSKKALDEQAAVIKSNIAAEFMRLKTQAGKSTTLSSQGLGLLDPDGVITKELAKYVRNRVQSGITDVAQIVDDAHALIKEFADGVTRRQIQEAISGYGKPVERRSDLEREIARLKSGMKTELRLADIEAGQVTEKRQGPPTPPRQGPKETKAAIQSRYQKQINELERRIKEQDFAPKPKRGPTVLDTDTQKIHVNLERAKQDFQRKLRAWEYSQRSEPEKIADLAVNWSRAAKLMYVSTLGKLGSAATGRMVMSPIENLLGEIPHRLMPKLSAQAATEGGGFSKAAEVAALWKSGRFRQVLDQLTKGSSDLDVLLGSKKSIDKEMSSPGLLGIPGRIHGAFKEYPRQAGFDRAFVKVLKNYEGQGRDITRPDVQLAARMEAFNSAERARFQQHNIISDTFNRTMGTLERQGALGKTLAKGGRFIFPITRVPVNVVGETLNYTFGLPRAVAEHMTRTIRGTMTPEKADNIMRAYKKGGVGLAVMTYAFLHPQQFGGYYQKGEKRDPNEPQSGEIMFFGHRIPKIFTHVPIFEAAQLAATARRVMDRMTEQGKDDVALGGGLEAGKGLAEQVPFYETPARFFTGQEGPRGVATTAGQLVQGQIPGFVQEAAKFTDKDKQGQPIPRQPQGGFAQRFGQTVEMGIPGLRQRVPVNETKAAAERKQSFQDRFMQGSITEKDLNKAVKNSELTQSEADSIVNQKDLSKEYNPRQLQFFKTPTLTSNKTSPTLDRFERMVPAQRMEVQKIMQEKADSIMSSDALTDNQKRAFAERLKRVGLEVHGIPKKVSSNFTSRFMRGPQQYV